MKYPIILGPHKGPLIFLGASGVGIALRLKSLSMRQPPPGFVIFCKLLGEFLLHPAVTHPVLGSGTHIWSYIWRPKGCHDAKSRRKSWGNMKNAQNSSYTG